MRDFDAEYVIQLPKRDANNQIETDGDGVPVMEEVRVSRDERASRERSFKIGGEVFHYRPAVAPEKVLRWSKMGAGELPGLTEEEAIGIFDETVLAFLVPGQEEKWGSVRSVDAENPLSATDIRALIRWLFEVMSGRPTEQPSASSPGSATLRTGTSSTDDSSSEPVAAAV